MSNSGGGATAVQLAPPPTVRRRGWKSFGYWAWAWLPVLAGIGLIALESSPFFGADHTSRPLRKIFEALFGPVSDIAWEEIHHLIRKTGHFFGYGFIGLAWLRAWWMTLPRTRYLQNALLSLLATGLLATWDEWHQSYLPNRTSSPWDVLIDCCGATALCLMGYFLVRLFHPERLARA